MNTPKLTKEHRQKLKPYERHLHTAAFSQYVVGLDQKTAKTLFEIYNEVFEAHESNISCNCCVTHVT